MNHIRNVFTTSLLSLAAGAAPAAGSPGVEHNTQGFLEALAKGGGQPLETLSPADARAVLVGAQAGQSCHRPTSARGPSQLMASRSS